jgi:hypothetical protein
MAEAAGGFGEVGAFCWIVVKIVDSVVVLRDEELRFL